jgi:hypothetical protein
MILLPNYISNKPWLCWNNLFSMGVSGKFLRDMLENLNRNLGGLL